MPEIKRGYQIGDYEVRREARELAPYPAWKAWRYNLFNYIRTNNFGVLNSREDPFLHERYRLSIKYRQNKITKEAIEEYSEKLKEEHPELFENPAFVLALEYIEKRIQKPKVK